MAAGTAEVRVSAIIFLTSWANSPFAVAIGAVGVFALLQATGLLGLIAGGGDSEHDVNHDVGADADHDVEHDADHDAEAERGPAAAAAGILGFVLKSILEAGAAYPLLRELMSFAKTDSKALTDKAQSALDELTTEIGAILKKEEGTNGSRPTTPKPAPLPGIDVRRHDGPHGVGE